MYSLINRTLISERDLLCTVYNIEINMMYIKGHRNKYCLTLDKEEVKKNLGKDKSPAQKRPPKVKVVKKLGRRSQ